ncbi:replicative DNA helicase [Streptomyces chumphonensis]|uniref:replicative DNA helicase n=1 Tax=Streptomyces chumphonensis TaxID=1214925 RepID=UPI003D702D94
MNGDIVTDTFERIPPQDAAAEQCVLGGMLLSKRAIADVMEILDPADFYKPAHETIYRAICDVYGGNEPVDAITMANHLREIGLLAKVGGQPYLHELVRSVPTAANSAYYAEIVRDHAVRRRIVEAGARIQQIGFSGEGEAHEATDAARAELDSVMQVREEADSALFGEDLHLVAAELEKLAAEGHAMGVPTGFVDLDSLTHGLHPGQMVIVAGRPALGKSTLGLDMMRSCSIRHRRPSVMFSLEMSRREVQHRVISAEAKIGLHKMRGGSMTNDDWARFANETRRLAAAPLTIDATPNRTVAQIRARCRQLKQTSGLDLVVIDYLQLLDSSRRRVENRQLEVSEMSRSIKLMAKELEVPVVVMCQLNRGPEQRTDKKPMLSDLRESGSLEQDADLVILLHREDAYDKESTRAGEADLIVAKHRAGPTALITVAFQGHYSRFVDMAQT